MGRLTYHAVHGCNTEVACWHRTHRVHGKEGNGKRKRTAEAENGNEKKFIKKNRVCQPSACIIIGGKAYKKEGALKRRKRKTENGKRKTENEKRKTENGNNLIKRNFIKVYSSDDMVCADFVRDVRLGRISFNSREDTSMIINSICCDWL